MNFRISYRAFKLFLIGALIFGNVSNDRDCQAQSYLPNPVPASATPLPSQVVLEKFISQSKYRGWDSLVEKLRASQVDELVLKATYQNRRMPMFSLVTFKLAPRESKAIYSNFLKPERLALARNYLKQYRRLFSEAERKYQVTRFVVAAIMLVETQFGRFTGKELVINQLSRLASASDPTNVQANFELLSSQDSTVTLEQVQNRARYLEETFYPEVVALFEIARRRNLDLFGIKGSIAGAFGHTQFLPTSYLKFGVDASQDGIVSLFQTSDAIWSVANYLAGAGWVDSGSTEIKRKAIWTYNRSDAYVDAVLGIASLLAAESGPIANDRSPQRTSH